MRIAKPNSWTTKLSWRFSLVLFAATCTQAPPEKREATATATTAPAAAKGAPPAPPDQPQPHASEAPLVAAASFRPEEDVAVRLQKEVESAAKADPAGAARMSAVRPVLTCVEKTGSNRWRAHFGYKSKASKEITIGTGLHNRLWPPPIAQGQPTAFSPGSRTDALELPFVEGTSVAWVLGQSFDVATKSSPICRAAGTKVRSTHTTAH
jgi:hypothetical protein